MQQSRIRPIYRCGLAASLVILFLHGQSAHGTTPKTVTVNVLADSPSYARVGEAFSGGDISASVVDPPSGDQEWSWSASNGTISPPNLSVTYSTAGTYYIDLKADVTIKSGGTVVATGSGGKTMKLIVVEVTSIKPGSGVLDTYAIGDTMVKTDFEVVTNPAGNSGMVSFTPPKIAAGANKVTATCGTSSATVTITAPVYFAEGTTFSIGAGDYDTIGFTARIDHLDGTFAISGSGVVSGDTSGSLSDGVTKYGYVNTSPPPTGGTDSPLACDEDYSGDLYRVEEARLLPSHVDGKLSYGLASLAGSGDDRLVDAEVMTAYLAATAVAEFVVGTATLYYLGWGESAGFWTPFGKQTLKITTRNKDDWSITEITALCSANAVGNARTWYGIYEYTQNASMSVEVEKPSADKSKYKGKKDYSTYTRADVGGKGFDKLSDPVQGDGSNAAATPFGGGKQQIRRADGGGVFIYR